MVKTIKDALPDFTDYVGDGDVGTFLTEVGAALVPGPGGIEGSVVSKDFEGNHFQLMEDSHEDMKYLIVSLSSDARPEIGKGSIAGDVFQNAGILPVDPAPVFIPHDGHKGIHVIGVVVDIAEEVEEEE